MSYRNEKTVQLLVGFLIGAGILGAMYLAYHLTGSGWASFWTLVVLFISMAVVSDN